MSTFPPRLRPRSAATPRSTLPTLFRGRAQNIPRTQQQQISVLLQRIPRESEAPIEWCRRPLKLIGFVREIQVAADTLSVGALRTLSCFGCLLAHLAQSPAAEPRKRCPPMPAFFPRCRWSLRLCRRPGMLSGSNGTHMRKITITSTTPSD